MCHFYTMRKSFECRVYAALKCSEASTAGSVGRISKQGLVERMKVNTNMPEESQIKKASMNRVYLAFLAVCLFHFTVLCCVLPS